MMAVKLGESQGEFVHSSVQYDLKLQEMYVYYHLNKSCVMYYEILDFIGHEQDQSPCQTVELVFYLEKSILS